MVCAIGTRCVTRAVARKHHPRRHLDAEIAVGIEPERAQDRFQFRLRHDAGAAPGERLGDALVHLDLASRGVSSASAASSPLIEPPITSARLPFAKRIPPQRRNLL